MNWITRTGALALGVAWGCTTTNESHCGNQNGDATCANRDGDFPYCDRCTAVNDGCSDKINTDPGCHDGDIAGTSSSSSDGATSSVTTDTTTMTTSMTTTTMSSTDATDASTSGGATCPNGTIDEGEECDGDDLNGASCVTRGFPGGDLACTDSCTFDDSACDEIAGCHDHMVLDGEDCEPADSGEPADLTGADCMSVGSQFGGEGLACNDNCTFNTDGCCIADGFQCSDNVPCCGDCMPITNLCLGSG